MFLAAVLLKLGGFGLLLFRGLFTATSIVLLLIRVRAVGAIGVAILCCQTLDLKVLIAFTSVGHIAFVVIGVALGTHLRATVGALVLLRHGLRSSLGGANCLHVSGPHSFCGHWGGFGHTPKGHYG